MILVINEWIFHDLLGENGEDRFRETARFVLELHDSDDTIVEPNEERWRGKALRLESASDFQHRAVCQLFLRLFYDSDRTRRLGPDVIQELPVDTYDWAPPEDVYLLQAYDAAKADLLVTTDETLLEKVVEHGQFSCQMRGEFLVGYNPARK